MFLLVVVWISRTLNPIWFVDTGCLCLLAVSAQDFFQYASNGLTFVVKDRDTGIVGSSDDTSGRVSVPQSTL
jgi:hypothetical protein